MKTQATKQAPFLYANESLRICGSTEDAVKGEYVGEMDGTGLANLTSSANGAIIRL